MEEKLVGNAEFFPTRLAKSDAYLGTMGCCSRWRYCWVGGWCPKSLQSWFRRKFFPLIFLIKCTNDLPFRLNWNHWIVALLGCFCVCVWHLSACCLRPDWAEAKNPDWWGTLDLDGVFKCFISAHRSLLFSRCHSLFGFFSLWLHISSEKLTLSKTWRRVDDVGTGNSDWLISSLCSNSLTLPELTAADNRRFGHQTF